MVNARGMDRYDTKEQAKYCLVNNAESMMIMTMMNNTKTKHIEMSVAASCNQVMSMVMRHFHL